MHLLYRGPRAWLVWLSLLVACVALIPSLLEIFLWLLHESHGFPFGESSAIPQIFGAKILGTIGENEFLAGIPALFACILVPLLLSTSRIPLPTRMVTAFTVVATVMVMFVQVGELHREFLQGRFNFLF